MDGLLSQPAALFAEYYPHSQTANDAGCDDANAVKVTKWFTHPLAWDSAAEQGRQGRHPEGCFDQDH
ncbi:hypothetical protein WJX81_008680 [Elliptochloris bilobata]|uniref:Uncharacterized protein n=1 Tax=Elliptochloris bilobata TaxID=381761 RepID=A0AAW1SLC0_9CHLO